MHQAERGEQLKELEDDSHIAAPPASQLVFVHFMDGGAVHQNFADRGTVDAGDHVQQGGFATARFADDADKFARTDLSSQCP